MPAPDPSKTRMWQDPILGYFESHGKMEFKPTEQYDLNPSERRGVSERYKIKELLKAEYLRREFDPLKRQYIEGIIVDPAMFRWYAAEMSNLEAFRMTPKTVFLGLICTIVPLYLVGKYCLLQRTAQDRKMKSGEYLWWDKENRTFSSGGWGQFMD